MLEFRNLVVPLDQVDQIMQSAATDGWRPWAAYTVMAQPSQQSIVLKGQPQSILVLRIHIMREVPEPIVASDQATLAT